MNHCCAVASTENCREFSSGMNFTQVGSPRIDVSGVNVASLVFGIDNTLILMT